MTSSVVSGPDGAGREVGGSAVTGGQDAPHHGGQVRREQHRGAEALLHLGGVPVVEEPVGHEVLVHRARSGGCPSAPVRPRRPRWPRRR